MMMRPVVWFAAASMWTTILHELAHACAAFVLGVPSTLFNYSADLDMTPAQAASNLPVLIRLAGPGFCLMFGTCCWLGFRRTRGSAAALPLLFFSVFGLGTFFGNLMSASFVGDFSSAAEALRLPMPIRYALTAIGAVAVAAIHFWGGRELGRSLPAHAGRMAGMLVVVAVPVVFGTAAVMLVNQPMPAASMSARLAEAAFWVFAAAGALLPGGESRDNRDGLELRWADGAAAILAVLVVRLMVRGIPFVP